MSLAATNEEMCNFVWDLVCCNGLTNCCLQDTSREATLPKLFYVPSERGLH